MRRSRFAADEGFTLIELLVVILIIGILVTVGLATFLNQRGKAQDAAAKSAVATAEKAMETWSTEHGSYAGATTAGLVKIEPSLGGARNLSVTSTAKSYTVAVDSLGQGGTFSIARADDGSVVRDCTNPGAGTCAAQPDAQGDRW
jgi:prepilin-type N-terminal cleavage/methylation domain-containing protein